NLFPMLITPGADWHSPPGSIQAKDDAQLALIAKLILLTGSPLESRSIHHQAGQLLRRPIQMVTRGLYYPPVCRTLGNRNNSDGFEVVGATTVTLFGHSFDHHLFQLAGLGLPAFQFQPPPHWDH